MCWEVRTGGRDVGHLGKTLVEVLLSCPYLRGREKSGCSWTQHGSVLQQSLGVFPGWFPYSSLKPIPHLVINLLTEQYSQL